MSQTGLGITVQDLERYAVTMRTSKTCLAGDTTIRLRAIATGIVGATIVIDANGDHPETVTVTVLDNQEVTFTPALSYDHEHDAVIVRQDVATHLGSADEMQLSSDATATDTTINIKNKPSGIDSNLGWVVIDPYTVQCEIRKVTTISGTVFTVAALGYSHSENDPVLWTTEPVANVKWFGALGDNSNDDTTPIQRALNQTSAIKGKCYLPGGEYKLTNYLIIKSNTEVVGDGAMVSVLKPSFSPAVNHVIENELTTGNTDITLKNFGLDRSGSDVQHGMFFNGVTRLIFDGISVFGVPSTTSGAIGVSTIGVTTRLVTKDFRATNCYFSDTDNFAIQLGYVQNCTIANNTFQDCYREVVGIEPNSTYTAKNIAITGNSFVINTVPSGGSATGCIIVTETSSGTIHNVSITGNTVINTNTVASNANPGITVLSGEGISVVGNTVMTTNGVGIQIGSASVVTTGVIVSGNTIIDCNKGANSTPSGSGIALRNSYKCIVTNNYVYGTNHTHSIEETASAADNMLLNNYLRDTTPHGTLGTGTVYAGNKSTDSDNHFYVKGVPLHILSGDASAPSPQSGSDDLIIEHSGSAGMTILTPNDESGSIEFGDADAVGRGSVSYDHNNDRFNISIGGSLRARWNSAVAELVFQQAQILSTTAGDLTLSPNGDTITTKPLLLSGSGRVTIDQWIGANGVKAPGANPADFVLSGLTGVWEFGNEIEANQETISGTWKIPTNMDKTVVPTFKIGWSTTTIYTDDATDNETAEWQLEYLWIAPNEDTTAAAQETLTQTTVLTAATPAEGLVFTTFSGIDLPAAADVALFFKITRLSAGNDTIADTLELRGMVITFTSDKLGTAV